MPDNDPKRATAGVIGRGGTMFGTGVLGLGGGVPEPENDGEGGIGVHGLGGSKVDFFSVPGIPPGAGLVGQGGRQSDRENRTRLPHAPGVIGISGGTGRGVDLLPQHPLEVTGGVGVYGQGADRDVQMVKPQDETGTIPGPDVPSGPMAPGPGVVGRGGRDATRSGPEGAGVVGLAGSMVQVPGIAQTGDVGVVGMGAVGLSGTGFADRACILQSYGQPQLNLVPQRMQSPRELPGDSRPGDFLVTITVDQELGTEIAEFWFCKVGGAAGVAYWVQIA